MGPAKITLLPAPRLNPLPPPRFKHCIQTIGDVCRMGATVCCVDATEPSGPGSRPSHSLPSFVACSRFLGRLSMQAFLAGLELLAGLIRAGQPRWSVA